MGGRKYYVIHSGVCVCGWGWGGGGTQKGGGEGWTDWERDALQHNIILESLTSYIWWREHKGNGGEGKGREEEGRGGGGLGDGTNTKCWPVSLDIS